MAEEDIVLKKYLSDKYRFADLINGSIFGGKQRVKAENLTLLNGESDLCFLDKNGKRKTVMRYRDVIMKADFGTCFAVMAEENQTKIHYAMPVRNMLYDALSYTEQIEEIKKQHKHEGEKLTDAEFLSGMRKEDKLCPVITLVIYYGEKEWDAHTDLYGMLGFEEEEKIPQEIARVLPNYRINLIHAGNIEEPERYKSGLQLVFGMLKYKENKEKLRTYINENKEKLNRMDEETYHVIGVLLHEGERLEKYRKKENGGIGMCQAIEEMIQDGKKEGIKEEQLRIAAELKGVLPDEMIAQKTRLTLEIVKTL